MGRENIIKKKKRELLCAVFQAKPRGLDLPQRLHYSS